jgi:multidrug transporter EmrE-like cation transporter
MKYTSKAMATEYINGIFTEKYNNEAFRWALLMAGIESVGDASLKQYARSDDPKFFVLGQISYFFIAYVFQLALRDNKLGVVNTYWNGMTNIGNTFIGMAMGETYTLYQLSGILLVTAGILMI